MNVKLFAKQVWGCAVGISLVAVPALGESTPFADSDQPAFKIGDNTTTLGEVYKRDQSAFYELEKKKYDQIQQIAKEAYLQHFWRQKADKDDKSVSQVKSEYEKEHINISEKEVKQTLDRFKDHPKLKKLSKEERETQIRDYLHERARRDLHDGIVQAALKKGKLEIKYPEPQEPVYDVEVAEDDFVRYGPKPTHTDPMGCEGSECPITVIEYSEFQCPFCVRVLPDTKKVMTNYKGKVRWVVRDFPLSFHDRARPAAVAAQCAGKQGQKKFWKMYYTLFDNQRNLSDKDLKKYAYQVGVDKKKWKQCFENPKTIEADIDSDLRTGANLGVSGTPAFFINGRRLSGALPYSEFERVIEDELSKQKDGKES